MEFDHTSTDISLGLGKEVIRFWWPLSCFQGHIGTLKNKILIEKGLCAHYILDQWLAQIYQQDTAKKCLDFGDLDLIFKVTPL